jgi:hypothetical protein
MKNVSTQRAANIAKIGLIIIWLAFMYSLTSCGSSCSRTKRYWRKHRCVEVSPDKKAINRARRALDKKVQANESQYAFYNNEIIIFENN